MLRDPMTARLVEIPRTRTVPLSPAFSTSLGAVYKTDCLDLFAALKDNCIDAIFADPPFNIRKDYGQGKEKDNLGRQEYLHWCFKWLDQSIRVLKPGGSLFVYNLPRWAFHLAAYLEASEMQFRH
jgi:site-specific DNA-methyltransferase (adenine-specific)